MEFRYEEKIEPPSIVSSVDEAIHAVVGLSVSVPSVHG